MNAATGISERVFAELSTLAERHGITKLFLFGSRARGDYKRASDIDLAATGGNIAAFSLDVEEETYTLLFFDVVNLDQPVQLELIESIHSEGILIYEKS
jgi:predicted nucleotidyltransferase